MVADDPVAHAGIGPQRLGLAFEVVLDHGVGGIEDRLRRPVVLIEHDRGDLRKRILELQDVPEVGAAEAVHTLIGVADDADVVVAAGEEQDDLVLGLVGVLELVDEDVLEPLAVVLEHVGVLAEELDDVEQQVVEVHRPGLLQPRLVLGVHVGVLAGEDVAGVGGGLRGVGELVLPQRDVAVHAAWREALGIEPEVADDVAGEAHGVGLVVDRERARVAEHLGVAPEDAHARRVEGRHPHRLDHRPDEVADALAHLGGGLVGERDGEDVRRPHALVDQVGDAVGEHAGLARAGTGDDEQRPVGVHDGVELIGVEPARERARPRAGLGEIVDELVVGEQLGVRRVGHRAGHPTDGVSRPAPAATPHRAASAATCGSCSQATSSSGPGNTLMLPTPTASRAATWPSASSIVPIAPISVQ